MSTPAPAQPRLIAIAAMAQNRVIGKDGGLPWHFPADLKFFKQTTLGHPVLMGRLTFESIVARLGKPLPGRRNIVLSHTLPTQPGVEVIRHFSELANLPDLPSPIYLIGGAQLYSQLLPHTAEILLTCIQQPFEGDVFFPIFEPEFTLQEVLHQEKEFEIRRYQRIPNSNL